MALAWCQAPPSKRALLVVATVLIWLACQWAVVWLAFRGGSRISSPDSHFFRYNAKLRPPHWRPVVKHGSTALIHFGPLQIGAPATWRVVGTERTRQTLRVSFIRPGRGLRKNKIILYAYYIRVSSGTSQAGGARWPTIEPVPAEVSTFYYDVPRFARRYPTAFDLWVAVLKANPNQLLFSWGAARWRTDALLLEKALHDLCGAAYIRTPYLSGIVRCAGLWQFSNYKMRTPVRDLRISIKRYGRSFTNFAVPVSGVVGDANTHLEPARGYKPRPALHNFFVLRVVLFTSAGLMEPLRLMALVGERSKTRAVRDITEILSLSKLSPSRNIAKPRESHGLERKR